MGAMHSSLSAASSCSSIFGSVSADVLLASRGSPLTDARALALAEVLMGESGGDEEDESSAASQSWLAAASDRESRSLLALSRRRCDLVIEFLSKPKKRPALLGTVPCGACEGVVTLGSPVGRAEGTLSLTRRVIISVKAPSRARVRIRRNDGPCTIDDVSTFITARVIAARLDGMRTFRLKPPTKIKALVEHTRRWDHRRHKRYTFANDDLHLITSWARFSDLADDEVGMREV